MTPAEHDRAEAKGRAETSQPMQPGEGGQNMTEDKTAIEVTQLQHYGSQRKPRSRTNAFLFNFALIVLFGVAATGWIRRYTDWFEIVGGLLALGGAFTWLAFVLKILRDQRLKAMQIWADRVIFRGMPVRMGLGMLFVGGTLVVALGVGTIQVESFGSSDRTLQIYPAGSPETEPERLPAGGSVRAPVWTSWWLPRKYVVKIDGYPAALETVHPLQRNELKAPVSFVRRPVVLIRPLALTAELLENNPGLVTAQVNAHTIDTITNYSGQSLWIGCDEDVEVPLSVLDSWRKELDEAKLPRLFRLWVHPKTIGDPELHLKPGDLVDVEIVGGGGTPTKLSRIVVQRPELGRFITEKGLQ
jgi:hypothetical protein